MNSSYSEHLALHVSYDLDDDMPTVRLPARSAPRELRECAISDGRCDRDAPREGASSGYGLVELMVCISIASVLSTASYKAYGAVSSAFRADLARATSNEPCGAITDPADAPSQRGARNAADVG